MFPTSAFVPLKECSGVRFFTSPAGNGNEKGSMQMDREPRGPLRVSTQRNLEAKAALRILHYCADAFWVLLESTCSYFCWADSSSVTLPDWSGATHPVISPKYTGLKQLAIAESSKLSHTATRCHWGNLLESFSLRKETFWGPSCWKMLCKQILWHCPLNWKLLAFDKNPGFPPLPPATQ